MGGAIGAAGPAFEPPPLLPPLTSTSPSPETGAAVGRAIERGASDFDASVAVFCGGGGGGAVGVAVAGEVAGGTFMAPADMPEGEGAAGIAPESVVDGSEALASSDTGVVAVATVGSRAYIGACRAGGAMAHPIAPIMQLAAIARRTSRDVTAGPLRSRATRCRTRWTRSPSCRGE